MIRLCLFDLDQTLIDTEDMTILRESGRHRDDPEYADEVRAALLARRRHIITEDVLFGLRAGVEHLKLGVFTRAPRRYVEALLPQAYPGIHWDVLIAFEDVQKTKPNGQGVHKAMHALSMGSVDQLKHVMVVGDLDVDIRAAYNAGCRAMLFKQGWPSSYQKPHWRSLDLLADSVVIDQTQILSCLIDPIPQLPYLECLLEGGTSTSPRFDRIAKFLPDSTRHIVHAAGRYFPVHGSLSYRRAWHRLTQSVQENKDSTSFPTEWIEAVKSFIGAHYRAISIFPFGPEEELVVCVIPARPERVPRLMNFLQQLSASYGGDARHGRLRLTFESSVLAYKPGVQSHSHEHLNHDQRFNNVREHLYVANPNTAKGKRFLVIDDVSTTGATLLHAKSYLLDAGASSVECFCMAQTISDPLRLQ